MAEVRWEALQDVTLNGRGGDDYLGESVDELGGAVGVVGSCRRRCPPTTKFSVSTWPHSPT